MESPVLLADSVYWLGSVDTSDFLQINVYMVFRNGRALLIDPGPKGIFPQIRKALEKLIPPGGAFRDCSFQSES